MPDALSARSTEVLHSIVQSYIETGEPVPSRTIARQRKDGISAATVRNIMADLSDLGYLDQPHTSAGRVPTQKAFAHFAESVAGSRLLAAELERLRSQLGRLETVEQRAEQTSHLLTELTRNVGIVAALTPVSQVLEEIELLLLPDGRILMVVVTKDRIIRNHVIQLAEPVSRDELASIRNFVNSSYSGWSLPEIRAHLSHRLEQESAAYDLMLRKLQLLYAKGLLNEELSTQVFLEGTANLIGLELHLTKERLRELFQTLEEKKRLVALLDQFLAANSADLQIQVGLEKAHPLMRGFSLIGLTVPLSSGMNAKMAVLGPMRMNYPRVMSAVLHLREALRSLPQ